MENLLKKKKKGSLVGDHFLYSHDLNVWFRGDIVGRSWMLINLKGQRIKEELALKSSIFAFEDASEMVEYFSNKLQRGFVNSCENL